MTLETFGNNASTTLNGSITAGASSLTVTAATAFPTTGNFRLLIDSELIIVGAVSGNTFSSLTRGAEGTTAATHSSGTNVYGILTAGAMGQMAQTPSLQEQMIGVGYQDGNTSGTVSTTFNSNGTISITYLGGITSTVTFNSDGSITETFTGGPLGATTRTKTTTFAAGTITETIT